MHDDDARDAEAGATRADAARAGAPARRGRPPCDPGAREARVFAALEKIVAAQGLRGVTMDAVARAAGVSKRTLYRVQPSRDALFAAWVRRLRAGLARATPPEAEALPLAERLRLVLRREARPEEAALRLSALRAVVAEGARNPDLARAFLREGPHAARAIVRAELERAVARGEVRLADTAAAAALLVDMANPSLIDALVDPAAAAPCAEGAPSPCAYGAGSLHADGAEARLALAIEVFLNGVAAPSERAAARSVTS